jgi:uncharacterized protein (DUF1778 family)
MTRSKPAVRKRPIPIRVMLSPIEKDMLRRAAEDFGVATSAFIRLMAVDAAKRRQREEKAA